LERRLRKWLAAADVGDDHASVWCHRRLWVRGHQRLDHATAWRIHVWPSDGLADGVLDVLLRVPAVHPAAVRHGRDEEMPELCL
jgi:hypothetical protein